MKKLTKKIKINLTMLLMITVAMGMLPAQNSNLFKVEKEISAAAIQATEVNTISFTVQIGGQQLYIVEKDVAYDTPFPDFRLFNDGSGVLIDAFEASLTFYNASGDEIVLINILKEKTIDYERSVYSAIAGGTLVIALHEPGMDELQFQHYNKKGQFLDQCKVSEKHLNGISLSENENIIALSVYDWQQDLLNKSTLFLDKSGRQLSRIQAGFIRGSFSDEEDLFIGYSNRDCFIYDFSDRTVHFRKSSPKNMMILEAQLYRDEIIIIESEKPVLKSGSWNYKNPRLERYDLNGRLLSKTRIVSKTFSEYELQSTHEGLIFRTGNTSQQLVK